MYDRPEPTNLNDIKELYTVPYSTTPFLGNVVPSRKYIDIESENLRAPVYLNKKSAIDTSQVVIFPEKKFQRNNNVSTELNNFYEQQTTIDSPDTPEKFTNVLDASKIGLGQGDFNNFSRTVNRWNYVDPSITQNVEHIIMNVKTYDGNFVSLPQCGLSSRNELRNYVEVNKC